jgi:hypothetical protein
MPEVGLRLGAEVFWVDRLLLCQASDLFANSDAPARYTVTSAVSSGILRTFVDAINGGRLHVTAATVDSLSSLCQEFQCPFLLQDLADFRNSPEYCISRLTDRVTALETRLAATIAGLTAAPDAPPLPRLSRLEAQVQKLAVSFADDIARLDPEVFSLKASVHLPDKSAIISSSPECGPGFAELLAGLEGTHCRLLWCGSRDGLSARDFHDRCDGHANTLTLIRDTRENIFGGFTPVEWESGTELRKADPSMKSFLFSLRQRDRVGVWKCPLTAEGKDRAIECDYSQGPCFGAPRSEIAVGEDANGTCALGNTYKIDPNANGRFFFTGSPNFEVAEIEVFEIARPLAVSLE